MFHTLVITLIKMMLAYYQYENDTYIMCNSYKICLEIERPVKTDQIGKSSLIFTFQLSVLSAVDHIVIVIGHWLR